MNQERELGWDDTIEKDGGGGFTLLPEGDYNFTVAKFERARYAGSANLPPCNQAKIELTIHCPQNGDVTIFHNLFLHTKTEGLLSNFFSGIGKKKKGERLQMSAALWNSIVGARGRCQLEHNKYTSKGEERVNNQVRKFYSYEELQGNQQQNYQQPQQGYQQQQQHQQQHQAPFPTGQQGGGWQQGQF